jgi:hypothetical protein
MAIGVQDRLTPRRVVRDRTDNKGIHRSEGILAGAGHDQEVLVLDLRWRAALLVGAPIRI